MFSALKSDRLIKLPAGQSGARDRALITLSHLSESAASESGSAGQSTVLSLTYLTSQLARVFSDNTLPNYFHYVTKILIRAIFIQMALINMSIGQQ